MTKFSVGDRVRDFHGKTGVIIESQHANGETACYEVLEPSPYHADEKTLTLLPKESVPLTSDDLEELLAYAGRLDINRVEAFDARQFMYLAARLRQRVAENKS